MMHEAFRYMFVRPIKKLSSWLGKLPGMLTQVQPGKGMSGYDVLKWLLSAFENRLVLKPEG